MKHKNGTIPLIKGVCMEFGKLLKSARIKQGLSQGYISKKLGFSTAQYISNVERGVAEVSPKMALRLAKIVGMEKVDILKALRLDHKKWLLAALDLD